MWSESREYGNTLYIWLAQTASPADTSSASFFVTDADTFYSNACQHANSHLKSIVYIRLRHKLENIEISVLFYSYKLYPCANSYKN